MRSKASSESTALTASLRKEQMKNDSLEQALQHKVKIPLLTAFTHTLQPLFFFFCIGSVLFCFVTLSPLLCHRRIKRLRNSQRSAMS